MQTVEIVKALRLCAGVARGPCEECPASDCDREVSCTTAMIGAADRLEELLERCARYAEEIAVLRERQRWIPKYVAHWMSPPPAPEVEHDQE